MPDEPFHPVKAYRDEAFLNSREARPLRILAEYMEPEERFRQEQVRDTIVMFGSARIPSAEAAKKALKIAKDGGGDLAKAEKGMNMSRYYEEARELAHRLTTWSKSLDREHRRFVICTGGGPGIATEVPAKYVYDLMFQAQNLGQGFAASTMMLLTVMLVVVPWAMLEFGGSKRHG